MSGTEADGNAPDMLAAEYVLGTLNSAETEAARLRRATDPAFAAEIRFWEARLAPLAALAPEVAPPEGLLARIETTIGGGFTRLQATAPANDNRLGWWQAATVAAAAIAAGLVIFVATRPAPEKPEFAVLSPIGHPNPVLVALPGPPGTILVRPSGVLTVPKGRDLQLWSLAEGEKRPVSLGVLPRIGTLVPAGVKPGTQLLVSLEPKGGSPTGLPTGPLVFGGTLQRAD